MKKLMCSLVICACFAGLAVAQETPNGDKQGSQQGTQRQGVRSAEDSARQKYALDIKKNGINKAVKNALKEGALSAKDIITVALSQGVNPVNILTVMSLNGVKANDIIAAKCEGVTPDLVTKAYSAVEQYSAAIAKSDNVEAAVKSSIEGGVLTLDNILEISIAQGVNPANVLTAMSNSGVNLNAAIAAAELVGVSEDTAQRAYSNPVASDSQAYTEAKDEEKGNQPNTPADRGQGATNKPPPAADPSFQLPVGTPGGGPPENFITPASPSKPV
jgi:hypothetical protein